MFRAERRPPAQFLNSFCSGTFRIRRSPGPLRHPHNSLEARESPPPFRSRQFRKVLPKVASGLGWRNPFQSTGCGLNKGPLLHTLQPSSIGCPCCLNRFNQSSPLFFFFSPGVRLYTGSVHVFPEVRVNRIWSKPFLLRLPLPVSGPGACLFSTDRVLIGQGLQPGDNISVSDLSAWYCDSLLQLK